MYFKKFFAGVLASVILTPVIISGLSINSYAATSIKISSANFPDSNFRNYVKQFDTSGDGYLSESEISLVESINISNKDHMQSLGAGPGTVVLNSSATSYSSLTGIEYFTELKTLNISYNPAIKSVDLSNNQKLTKIDANNTGLNSIDVSLLLHLQSLIVWNTNLDSIYIYENSELTYLDVSWTNINVVNLSSNPSLKELVNTITPTIKTYSLANSAKYKAYVSSKASLYSSEDTSFISNTPSNMVGINISNFESRYTRVAIFNLVDTNKDSMLSRDEIKNCTSLTISPDDNSCTKGLEVFTNLCKLTVTKSNIDSLDISKLVNLKRLTISNCSNLKSVNITNNPNLIKAFKAGKEVDGCYLSVGSTNVLVDGPSSPEGCSLFAMWQRLNLNEEHSFLCVDDYTCKVYEGNARIRVSNVIIPDGNSITATIIWNNTTIKTLNITESTDINIDAKLLKEFDSSYYSYTVYGHFDIIFTTSTGYVLYNLTLDAFNRSDYDVPFADTYGDSSMFYVNTDRLSFYVPEELRDTVASYELCRSYYYNSGFVSGTYNGEEKVTIVFPSEYLENNCVIHDSYYIKLLDKDGFTITTQYAVFYNTKDQVTYVKDVDCSNGIYHMADTTFIPIECDLTYDSYSVKMYYNDELVGYWDKEPYIGIIYYGTDDAYDKYGFTKNTYNGYLYPGTYRFEIWNNRINFKISSVTVEVTVSGFDASNAQPPVFPTVVDPMPTVTPVPSVTSTPGSSSTPTPTPAPSGTSTTQPTPTPVVPTAVPTKIPELGVEEFVKRCYSVALEREPDADGLTYWVSNLTNGSACGAQVGFGFIFSQEYTNKNKTNNEFVTDLYNMYFGRKPDTDGFNYWIDKLTSGSSREEVFAGFANSLEFYNLCSDYGVVQGIYLVGVPNDQQGGVNCFVARMYSVCLNRLPDMGGQAGWVLKLFNGEVTGTSCAYGFVFSPEFIGKGLTNEQFVAYMYRAFFGREPDQGGFNSWVKMLNDGASYEDVFAGFSGSAEFYNLCGSYGINA